MKKNQLFSKAAAIGAAVAMSLAAQSLAAQASPASPDGFGVDPTSKTNESTAGRMGTDVDNFLGVLDWTSVKFDKAFGFIGYESSSAGPVNIGFATKAGSLYLGTFYAGNIARVGNKRKEESVQISYDSSDVDHTETQRTTTTTITDPDVSSLNNIGLLIGLGGNMGLRFGFYENLVTSSEYSWGAQKTTVVVDGVSTSTKEYVDYSATRGNIVPSVSWGMAMPVGNMTLKPKVDAALNIYYGDIYDPTSSSGEYTHNEKVVTALGAVTQDETTKTTLDNGYINPVIQIGADLDFAPGESSEMGLGLSYKMGFQIYGDEYGTLTDYKNKLVGSESSTLTKAFKDSSASEHVITPALWYSKTVNDRLSLGLKAELPLTFGSASEKDNYESVSTNSGYTTTITGSTGVDDTETSTFSIAPAVSLGAQFKAVPNRFTLNAGIKATVIDFTSRTEKTTPTTQEKTVTKAPDGNVTTTIVSVANTRTSETTTSNWDAFDMTLGAGFTFFFTDNIAVDVGFSSDGGFDVDTSSLGVLFTIKK